MLAPPHSDVLSELLVAQLLEEDLRDFEFSQQAERLQLDQLIADSSKGNRRIPKYARMSVDDEEIAVRLMVQGARLTSDASLAQTLQHSTDVNHIASQQLAQKLAATERKILLDAEFARRLQDTDDAGDFDTDAPNMRDAERYEPVPEPYEHRLINITVSWVRISSTL